MEESKRKMKRQGGKEIAEMRVEDDGNRQREKEREKVEEGRFEIWSRLG